MCAYGSIHNENNLDVPHNEKKKTAGFCGDFFIFIIIIIILKNYKQVELKIFTNH